MKTKLFATLMLFTFCGASQAAIFTYQGRVRVGDANYSGAGRFKFALVEGSTTYWSNDGSAGEPAAHVTVGVSEGLFTVRLGDTNMNSIPGGVFNNPSLLLRIWFNDGTNGFAALAPDQPLTPAPYALHALSISDAAVDAGKLASNSVTSAKIVDGSIQLADLNASVSNAFWRLSGNIGTVAGTHFLGTIDSRPLEFRVGGGTALRLVPNFFAPSIVGGYGGNELVGNPSGAVIAGGGQVNDVFGTNRVAASHGTISGGKGHIVSAFAGVVGGGFRNEIEIAASTATIAGGRNHVIQSNAVDAAIGGGQNNRIGTNSQGATIAGGLANQVGTNAQRAAIGGGYLNSVLALHGVVGGGIGNQVAGAAGTVPGGSDNVAGAQSFAAGSGARATHTGAFVWADSLGASFSSLADNEFAVRANGGARFTTGSGGAGQTVSWTPGNASWSFTSDRSSKEKFRTVNKEEVLEKVSQLPVSEWSFKGHPQRHIGPTAQDFHTQFPLNSNERQIDSGDLHGVTLAAIQALNQKLKDKDAELADLKARLGKLEAALKLAQ